MNIAASRLLSGPGVSLAAGLALIALAAPL